MDQCLFPSSIFIQMQCIHSGMKEKRKRKKRWREKQTKNHRKRENEMKAT